MAKRVSGPRGPAPKVHMSADEIQQGIRRIETRIRELEAFDPRAMNEPYPPELTALSTSIQRSVEKTFGEDTADCRRFSAASHLRHVPTTLLVNRPTPLSEYQQGVDTRKRQSLALLAEAVRTLKEDLAELGEDGIVSSNGDTPSISRPLERQVFIVHGHEIGPREAVARFLQSTSFQPIILNEQANQNRTIIEKIEAHADVGFAVVLLTPDDEGGRKGEAARPRARQNVLELASEICTVR